MMMEAEGPKLSHRGSDVKQRSCWRRQSGDPVLVRDYLKSYSARLERPMESLWFGDRGQPVLFFPTSMGRFYQVEDFGLIGSLREKIDAGAIQAYCVDSVDDESWYSRSSRPADRVRRHAQYDA